MTKAQQTYERIEALVAAGSSKADAYKQLAKEYGQSVDSVRGAYYTGRKQASGEPTSARPGRSRKRRETTEHDAIGQAVTTLQDAIASIHSEVEDARERAEEAQLEYEAMTTAAEQRITAIQTKIAALTDEEVTD